MTGRRKRSLSVDSHDQNVPGSMRKRRTREQVRDGSLQFAHGGNNEHDPLETKPPLPDIPSLHLLHAYISHRLSGTPVSDTHHPTSTEPAPPFPFPPGTTSLLSTVLLPSDIARAKYKIDNDRARDKRRERDRERRERRVEAGVRERADVRARVGGQSGDDTIDPAVETSDPNVDVPQGMNKAKRTDPIGNDWRKDPRLKEWMDRSGMSMNELGRRRKPDEGIDQGREGLEDDSDEMNEDEYDENDEPRAPISRRLRSRASTPVPSPHPTGPELQPSLNPSHPNPRPKRIRPRRVSPSRRRAPGSQRFREQKVDLRHGVDTGGLVAFGVLLEEKVLERLLKVGYVRKPTVMGELGGMEVEESTYIRDRLNGGNGEGREDGEQMEDGQ